MSPISRPNDFWKHGKRPCNSSGPELFTVNSQTVDSATDRNDLRPEPEAIEHYVNNTLGDHYFLFAVVSFCPTPPEALQAVSEYPTMSGQTRGAMFRRIKCVLRIKDLTSSVPQYTCGTHPCMAGVSTAAELTIQL